MNDWPDMEYIKGICKIGQGAACCRYLTMGSGGWCCEKTTSLKQVLDARAVAGTMVALGDNCEGRPAAHGTDVALRAQGKEVDRG